MGLCASTASIPSNDDKENSRRGSGGSGLHGLDPAQITIEDFARMRSTKQSRPKTAKDEQLERKKLVAMEQALQQNLRESSLPMIMMEHPQDEEDSFILNLGETGSASDADVLTPTVSPTAALSKSRARRQSQRRKILEAATRSNKWLLFHDMNLFDDEEVHIVKLFLDIVMHRVPGTFWSEEESLHYESELERITLSRENSFDDLIMARRAELHTPTGSASPSVRSESSEVEELGSPSSPASPHGGSPRGRRSRSNSTDRTLSLSQRITGDTLSTSALIPHVLMGDIEAFTLPPGNKLTMQDVVDIIEVYRHEHGKLDESSVHKLLRLAYRQLKESPNVNYVRVEEHDTVVVVGDIHGQLSDLLHILDEAGLPGENVKYIFNGDFVDRGTHSCEVMCVLLALLIVCPRHVTLNRGNHEDFAICCAYGFQRECCDKYNELTFGMFCELFQQLPLFAVLNDSVLVLHGGLFRNRDVRMDDLKEIPRHDFSLRDMPEGGETLHAVSTLKRKEYLNQLQRDALWSDPQPNSGYAHNSRGAGVSFGKDIVMNFLENNHLDMIVRSHECVDRGFELPFIDGPEKPLLCTIFSASNYSGLNDGAYMRFRRHPDKFSKAVRKGMDLFFDVFSYNIQKGGHLGTNQEIEPVFLSELLYNKRDEIHILVDEADPKGTGEIKSEVWATIMRETTHLHIHWISMVPLLVPEHCVTELGNIKYHDFLLTIDRDPNEEGALGPGDTASEDGLTDKLSGSDVAVTPGGQPLINALYTQHKHLETVFRFFDLDNSGAITRDHFCSGCDLLNKTLTKELQLPDSVGVKTYDDLFDLLDIDGTDDVCENSFFELYRIVHTKDKSTDAGVDDEGNVHLGLGEIIVRSDSDAEVTHQREAQALIRSDTEHELHHEHGDIPLNIDNLDIDNLDMGCDGPVFSDKEED